MIYKKILFIIILIFCFGFINIGEAKEKEQPVKTVYLTFDDGPSENTGKILDILEQYDAKATFFVVGINIRYYPDLLTKIAKDGHYIGLHTMTHNMNSLYLLPDSPERFLNEVKEEQSLIFSITGELPVLVRPPYSNGSFLSKRHIAKLVENGFKVWDWDIDTKDWATRSIYQIQRSIINELKGKDYPDHAVVLMHEKKVTVAALPYMIELLKQQGYTEFKSYDPNHHFPVNFNNNPDI